MRNEEVNTADIAASFQEAVADVLSAKLVKAALSKKSEYAVLAGGVASNSRLRELMRQRGEQAGIKVLYPSPILCTDNAAMIGCAAYYRYISGTRSDFTLNAIPNLSLE
jgi:N6-L-threonylcarbamoyladenine synthase